MKPYQNIETWKISKPVVRSENGLVSSQHYLATEAGSQVLAAGGNAVDAAIATGLALGIVEPWMSGLGGGGFMQFYDASRREVYGLDFAMVAPQGVNPADYPLVGGEGEADTFNWPTVFEDRHTQGPYSIAVPGLAAGMAEAHARWATKTWRELIEPSLALAEFGLPIDWFATQKIAHNARPLRQYPTSAAVYLPDGLPPVAPLNGEVMGLPLDALRKTYQRLADVGPTDMYAGELASDIVADSNEVRAQIAAADLEAYKALPFDGEALAYRDAKIWAPIGLNAGPSLRRALELLEAGWSADADMPNGVAFAAYADALLVAYRERLERMGVGETSDPGATTHLGVVDNAGNIVTWTQTVMSAFGSRVVFPRTGLTMNNGMMWFDPRPHQPNSIRPGVRPLSNMCPTIVERADGFRFAIGACGGRRIFPSVFQLISFLVDYPMSLDDAIHHPRIDVSGTNAVAADNRLDGDVLSKLSERYDVMPVTHGIYPNRFALPNVVGQTGSGEFVGGAFVYSPTALVG
ncbi:MAG: gamma-glutamyltransferase [Pseudomonadota bacterium]